MEHFLTIRNLDPDRLAALIDLAHRVGSGRAPPGMRLDGKIVGLLFRGPSTRTRTAFAVAALKLGAQVLHFGRDDLQLVTGETPEDTGSVLSQFLDALVIRTNGPDSEMHALASQSRMAIINAMSRSEHPTQVIGDLVTIKEATGGLSDRHVVYFGEGNNTAAALALAVAMVPGMRLTLMTPAGYGLAAETLRQAQDLASRHGSEIVEHHDLIALPASADVVYTTRWQTMGVPHDDPDWRQRFSPFKVTAEIMSKLDHARGTIFMHDLPAVRGQDCDDVVLDGPRSLAIRQAYHKMSAAMAILHSAI